MNAHNTLDELIEKLRRSRDEVEQEIERLLEGKRAQFNYTLQRGKVVFDRNVRRFLQGQRTSSLSYIVKAKLPVILSSPLIYSMIVPIAFMDICISVYQHVCFRIYNIPIVKRSEYIVVDRHRLPYLNTIQKINCVYCSYGNGLIAYTREIIARTEQYWCPIKHASRSRGLHDRESKFLDYGDADAWKNKLETIRCDWEDTDSPKQ